MFDWLKKKKKLELDDATYNRIKQFTDQGNSELDAGNIAAARNLYIQALQIVPNPPEDWEASTWIFASIGDTYHAEGNFSKVLESFQNAIRCPGGLGNPFIHLRLGQASSSSGIWTGQRTSLPARIWARVRKSSRKKDPKYLAFVRQHMKI